MAPVVQERLEAVGQQDHVKEDVRFEPNDGTLELSVKRVMHRNKRHEEERMCEESEREVPQTVGGVHGVRMHQINMLHASKVEKDG